MNEFTSDYSNNEKICFTQVCLLFNYIVSHSRAVQKKLQKIVFNINFFQYNRYVDLNLYHISDLHFLFIVVNIIFINIALLKIFHVTDKLNIL